MPTTWKMRSNDKSPLVWGKEGMAVGLLRGLWEDARGGGSESPGEFHLEKQVWNWCLDGEEEEEICG